MTNINTQSQLINDFELNKITISNEKIKKIGGVIDKSTRTAFKLSDGCHELLKIISKKSGQSLKKFLDNSSEILSARIDDDERLIREFIPSPSTTRKTYVLSEKSLEILNSTSKRLQISRDCVLEATIWNVISMITNKKLTSEEKIERAQRLIELSSKMVTICTEMSSVIETIDDDPDFKDALEAFGYIATVNEFSTVIDQYIESKSAEAINTNQQRQEVNPK